MVVEKLEGNIVGIKECEGLKKAGCQRVFALDVIKRDCPYCHDGFFIGPASCQLDIFKIEINCWIFLKTFEKALGLKVFHFHACSSEINCQRQIPKFAYNLERKGIRLRDSCVL